MSFDLRSHQADPATPAAGKSIRSINTQGQDVTINASGVRNVLTSTEKVNVVRNAGLWFAQRQAPGTLTTYSSVNGRAFGPDGWAFTNENASVQYQRIDTQNAPEAGLTARFYGQVTKITATGKVHASQVIEGADVMPFRGRSVRLQVRLKQVVGAAPVVRLALLQLTSAGTIDTIPATFISAHGANGVDPTLGTNLAYITPKAGVTADGGTVNGNAVDCTLSASWQRFGAVFDVPSNCKNLVVLLFGANQFAAAAGFAWSEVTLTDGMEIQEWKPLPYLLELQRVQRYYCKTFNVDTAPAQNVGVNTGELKWTKVVAAATATRSPAWYFPVPMRLATPTIVLYNPAAANAQVRDVTGAVDCTASAAVAGGERSVAVTATGAAGTAAENLLSVHLSADAEL